MERDQAMKFMHDLLRLMSQKKGSDLFITAGFPDMDSFWIHLERIDGAGADIIEIGVPFSDPVADGPVIEDASRDALARGVSLKWILDGLKARKGQFSAKLVLMVRRLRRIWTPGWCWSATTR